MSTLKADAVTSAQDNTALTLSGTGTGGVKVNDYLIQTKGSDISSATSLTLGKDGNQFDVTGTTTITSIATQGIGSYVTLHFDGALTFTHHSTNLILPGAASITTAAGDIAVMYEYASADWRCVSYTKASGAAVVAGGGAWNILETEVADNSATSITLDWASSASTYDTFVVAFSDFLPATDSATGFFRVGDSAGIDSASSDYEWTLAAFEGVSFTGINNTGGNAIHLSEGNIGNTTGEGISGFMWIMQPGDGVLQVPCYGWSIEFNSTSAKKLNQQHWGHRDAVITTTQCEVGFLSGNIVSGRATVWGIAHA